MKYFVYVTVAWGGKYGFESNSRNARRHLMEQEADMVIVCSGKARNPVSIAARVDGAICVGTYHK